MRPDVANFLLMVLSNVPLNAGADDFEQAAALIVEAKKELKSIIESASPDHNHGEGSS